MGIVTPLGPSYQETFDNLLQKKSGLRVATTKDIEYSDQLRVKTVGLLNGWNQEEWLHKIPTLKSIYHLVGGNVSDVAFKDSGWTIKNESDKLRTGIVVGGTKSSLIDARKNIEQTVKYGLARQDKLVFLNCISSKIIGTISIAQNIAGYASSISSGYCSGSNAL